MTSISTDTWSAPEDGDFLWCNFPHLPSIEPGPKPRPVLLLQVRTFSDGLMLLVVPGTTQGLHKTYPGEVSICADSDSLAFNSAGLSFDTKFQFANAVVLPWNTLYFKAPSHKPFGDTPKLGVLHPTKVREFSAAYAAYRDRLSWL